MQTLIQRINASIYVEDVIKIKILSINALTTKLEITKIVNSTLTPPFYLSASPGMQLTIDAMTMKLKEIKKDFCELDFFVPWRIQIATEKDLAKNGKLAAIEAIFEVSQIVKGMENVA